jgi:hypothetical protein
VRRRLKDRRAMIAAAAAPPDRLPPRSRPRSRIDLLLALVPAAWGGCRENSRSDGLGYCCSLLNFHVVISRLDGYDHHVMTQSTSTLQQLTGLLRCYDVLCKFLKQIFLSPFLKQFNHVLCCNYVSNVGFHSLIQFTFCRLYF